MPPASLLLALTPALAADTTYIYEMEGTDTVAAEVFLPTATGVRGRIVVRRPALREATYSITIGEDGLPDAVQVEWRVHEEGGARVETAFTATLDGAVLRMAGPGGATVGEYPVPAEAVPMTGRRPIAYGMLHTLMRATPPDGTRTVRLLIPGQTEPIEATLTRDGGSFRVDAPSLRIQATVEDDAITGVTSRVISGAGLRTFQATSSRFRLDAFLHGGE